MSAPRGRPSPPDEVPNTVSGNPTAVLESEKAVLVERLNEAELQLAIELAASRILGFALARGAEERDPEE